MFDVKTGLLMFTTRRAIMASKRANEWRTDDKLAQLASNAVAKFAPDLAQDFLLDVRRFANAAIAENERTLRCADASCRSGASGRGASCRFPARTNR